MVFYNRSCHNIDLTYIDLAYIDQIKSDLLGDHIDRGERYHIVFDISLISRRDRLFPSTLGWTNRIASYHFGCVLTESGTEPRSGWSAA